MNVSTALRNKTSEWQSLFILRQYLLKLTAFYPISFHSATGIVEKACKSFFNVSEV